MAAIRVTGMGAGELQDVVAAMNVHYDGLWTTADAVYPAHDQLWLEAPPGYPGAVQPAPVLLRYVAIIPPPPAEPTLLYTADAITPAPGNDVWEDVRIARMLAAAEVEYGRDYAAPFLAYVRTLALLPPTGRFWLATVADGVLGYPVEVAEGTPVPPGHVLSDNPHRWHNRAQLDLTNLLLWEQQRPWLQQ